jgi:hypothetical protein
MIDCKSKPHPFCLGYILRMAGIHQWWKHLVSTTCGEPSISHPHRVRSLICSRGSFQVHARSHMSYTGRLQSASLDMFRAPQVMGSTMQQVVHWISWDSLILIGLVITQDHKSTSGYMLSLGSGPICWSRKKQSTISLSSTEVEYRGVVNVTIQELWLQNFLTELGIQFHHSTVIWCDNQSTLKFCRDLVQRQWTKHIEIHMHYIREMVHDRIIDLQYCPSTEQTTDIFTKTFTEQKFHLLVIVLE